MGIIGKRNGKIRIILNKLNCEVGVFIHNLPLATSVGRLADSLHNYVGVFVGDLNPEVRVFSYNLHPAMQRNAFAAAGILINRLPGYKYRQQHKYKTVY